MKKNNIIWGLVLIIIGLIIGLNRLDIISFNLFFNGWWCFFIIIPCFIGLLTDKEKTGSLIGLIIGILLFLGSNDIIDYSMIWSLLLPIILVMIGLSIVLKNTISTDINKEIKKIDTNNNKEYSAVFSGQKVSASKDFNGANINAIFGGVELDLTNINLKEDIVINTCSVFGGIDLKVSDDVNVKIKSTSIFGGCEDKRKNITNDNKHTIYINAFCLFGGVDIK